MFDTVCGFCESHLDSLSSRFALWRWGLARSNTVIGVLPKDFVFQSRLTDYWIPANLTPMMLANRDAHFLNVVARLKAGATMAQASEDLHAIARRLQQQGLYDKRADVVVVPPEAGSVGQYAVCAAGVAGSSRLRASDRMRKPSESAARAKCGSPA